MSKWTKEEEYKALELLRNGENYKEISIKLNKSECGIRNKLHRLGETILDYKVSTAKENIICLYCDKEFIGLKKEARKFCSSQCSLETNVCIVVGVK